MLMFYISFCLLVQHGTHPAASLFLAGNATNEAVLMWHWVQDGGGIRAHTSVNLLEDHKWCCLRGAGNMGLIHSEL